ncbi:c-type cytochrome [Marixanthomonas spongiae]|nr:cytochrome c [Marixanthomonas spongiae]
MKNSLHITIALLVASTLVSCFNEKERNYQYFPNMYQPVGYEAYGEGDIFVNGQEAKLPAEGSVPRGYVPFDYENTTADKARAKTELKNPFEISEENINEGEALYTIYCAVCHGDKGDGQGILAEREKFLGIPSYADPARDITMGDTYFVQVHGLNAMGSYASQVDHKERWQIAMHVMDLKAALNGNPGLLESKKQNTSDSTEVDTSEQDNDNTNDTEASNTSEEETN